MHPAVVSLHAAGLPDGVGEGAQGLPLYGLIEHDRWSFYAASPCAWRLL